MKKFAGFTPEQQYTLLTRQGYSGPSDEASMAKFLAASPSAAASMGKYAQIAQQRLAGKPLASPAAGMSQGGVVNSGEYGGYTYQSFDGPEGLAYQIYDPQGGAVGQSGSWASVANQLNSFAGMDHQRTNTTPTATTPTPATPTPTDPVASTDPTTGTGTATTSPTGSPQTAAQLQAASIQNPMSAVTQATVTPAQNVEGAEIAAGTGDAGQAAQADVSTVAQTATADTPTSQDAATYEAETVTPGVEEALGDMQAAQGMVSEAGTVRGQLASLMADFENDGTPPWASGAMRNAMATMAARGLGASSMAGQAIVQAAMEAALPIASQDAQTVAQFEMQNLTNEQQTSIFKAQQRIAGLFSDQAAQNAALQFNAAGENQTNQFFADLQSTVARFNAQQVNATLQFNAGQENAIEQFNAQQQNLREQFNAQNSLIIAQANAQWRQNLELTNTAAQNEANMANARAANGFTQTALDAIWQRERDLMAFAFQSSESEADRNLQILLADKGIQAQRSASRAEGWGYLAGQIVGSDWAGDLISSFF